MDECVDVGEKGERGQADENARPLRVRASDDSEEGGRRREEEEKSQWKSMREQASVNSFTFKAFF